MWNNHRRQEQVETLIENAKRQKKSKLGISLSEVPFIPLLAWGTLKREDSISLLRAIMASCESFVNAQAVSIDMDKETKCWNLSVSWAPSPFDCLDKILTDFDVEAVTTKGRTVFRSH